MNLFWFIQLHTNTELYKTQPQNKYSTHDCCNTKWSVVATRQTTSHFATFTTRIPLRPGRYQWRTRVQGNCTHLSNLWLCSCQIALTYYLRNRLVNLASDNCFIYGVWQITYFPYLKIEADQIALTYYLRNRLVNLASANGFIYGVWQITYLPYLKIEAEQGFIKNETMNEVQIKKSPKSCF